jgi:hypothetical protein
LKAFGSQSIPDKEFIVFKQAQGNIGVPDVDS